MLITHDKLSYLIISHVENLYQKKSTADKTKKAVYLANQ